jgi:hypothetical protein
VAKAKRANEDVPLSCSQDLPGKCLDRPREIRVLLAGRPEKQKLAPERNRFKSANQ